MATRDERPISATPAPLRPSARSVPRCMRPSCVAVAADRPGDQRCRPSRTPRDLRNQGACGTSGNAKREDRAGQALERGRGQVGEQRQRAQQGDLHHRHGCAGVQAEQPACSGRKNCPSGKLAASRWAACTANVVLPIPAIPSIAWIPTTPRSAARPSIAPSSRASSAWRPVKLAMSRGSRSRSGRCARSPCRRICMIMQGASVAAMPLAMTAGPPTA